ncbi:hypothetical protein [uncultured Croceitalea sp.]|uniref:hypothetical protein n=1 Tax=uncultured Croceitalea sp. TaxID=1798908 RepID=UPI00374F2911
MGTSKSYKATVTGQPQWGNLSSSVTKSCVGTTVPDNNLKNILSKFTNVIGGSKKAGRANSKIAGRGGIRTAQKMGGFLGGFSASGGNLKQTLESLGLNNLVGKSAEDIINNLIEYCSGTSSTIDDRAAKEAIRKLMEEMTSGAETFEELENKLKASLDKESLQEIIIKYFGYYILEHLSVMFYEKLVREKGKTECSNLFKQIKDFIKSRLKEMNKTNPLKDMDWGSNDAVRIIKNILEDVLKVFEDEN